MEAEPKDQVLKKKAIRAAFYLKHSAKIKADSSAWAKANPEKTLLRSARKRAQNSGLKCDISVEDIVIPEFCPVFPWIRLEIGPIGPRTSSTPSLDRIDNTKGYVKGNVRVISWRANRLKGDATPEELNALSADWERIRNG